MGILTEKSYSFALKIIQIYKQLIAESKEYVLSKQLLKSGTAVGALVREAEYAQSRPDFINKLSIALKEANETEYWICLLRDSNFLSPTVSTELLEENISLKKILTSSINTSKSKLPQKPNK